MNRNLFIVWNNNNAIGFPIIDEQHRGLVSTINSLFFFTQIGYGEKIINDILLLLKEYTKIHFATEEMLLQKANCPDLDKHIQLHKDLIAQTQEFSINTSFIKDSKIILDFMKEWWLTHICVEDKKHAAYLRGLLDA